MKVSYELTRDDLAAFIAFHQQTSPTAQRHRLGCLAVGVLGMLLLPVWILLTTDKPKLETAGTLWPLLIGPVVFVVFAGPYIRWRTRQMTNRLLSEGQNNGFYGPCELELGSDSLTETRRSGTTTRSWDAVERVEYTASHLFIYTSGIEAYVVPRRAFSHESEFMVFLNAITARQMSFLNRLEA
tara:strand:+ start:630 stop:1181 length:552 start_codon:yes stop_codon:yes gene_type:complete